MKTKVKNDLCGFDVAATTANEMLLLEYKLYNKHYRKITAIIFREQLTFVIVNRIYFKCYK